MKIVTVFFALMGRSVSLNVRVKKKRVVFIALALYTHSVLMNYLLPVGDSGRYVFEKTTWNYFLSVSDSCRFIKKLTS